MITDYTLGILLLILAIAGGICCISLGYIFYTFAWEEKKDKSKKAAFYITSTLSIICGAGLLILAYLTVGLM